MKKETRDMLRQVLEWEEQGVPLSEIDGKYLKGWEQTVCTTYSTLFKCALGGSTYRRKPAPELIPWTAEDVPFPCAIRHKSWPKGAARTVLDQNQHGVRITFTSGAAGAYTNYITYKELADPDNEWEQLDGKPCAKEG